MSDNVTSIGEYAFAECDALTTLKMPSAIETIESCAFKSCIALERMTICDGVTIDTALFYGCEALKEVKLPSTLTTIPKSSFRDCVSLKKVEQPTGLTAIEDTPLIIRSSTRVSCPLP